MEETLVSKKIEIKVVYNGISQPLSVQSHEQVKAVLQRAIHLFGITQNAHLLSLFKRDGSELPDHVSIEDAGIQPCDVLALRPGAVKGG